MSNMYKHIYESYSGSYPTIVSSTGESMEEHYNSETLGISYKDKVILDLGASWGDSSEYFLHMGAKTVIAVEGNQIMYDGLLKTSELFKEKIIPIFLSIDNPGSLEKLIIDYKPDIVKADIEGAEIHLYNIKNEIWNLAPEYLIETHEGYLGQNLDGLMIKKSEENNYQIVKNITTGIHMIYAKKKEI